MQVVEIKGIFEKEIFPITLSWGLKNNMCLVKLEYNGVAKEVSERDYFECLCVLRKDLEQENIFLQCNGASLDVFPSGMARDMGAGLKAYRVKLGERASKNDLVFIFDKTIEIINCTVNEQLEYRIKWAKSLM